MPEPLVSVAMITYNHAPYLAQAIEGVLRQNVRFPFELVIGEDRSTDGTRDIVLGYQKNYPALIRVISSERNVGAAHNAYRTFKACQGKYVAFCEGDDYWHRSDKLQIQADYLDGHPECGLVFSSYDVYHVESKKRRADFLRHRKWEMPQDNDSLAFFNVPFPVILTCTVMTQRIVSDHIIEADPYLHQSGKFLMGDSQHWLEIAAITGVHYIPESLATHNITGESATRSKDIKKELRFGISSAELFLYLCDKYNLPKEFRDARAADWRDCSLRLALESRDPALADKVRLDAKSFTWKQWLRYYGAKHSTIYQIYRIAASLRGLFRREPDPWD